MEESKRRKNKRIAAIEDSNNIITENDEKNEEEIEELVDENNPSNDEEHIEVLQSNEIDDKISEVLVKENLIENLKTKEQQKNEKVDIRTLENDNIKVKKQEKNKISNKNYEDNIEIVRRIPDVNIGLTTDEAEDRKTIGLNNEVKQGSTKTIFSIIMSNILTVFNFINFGLGIWLISVGSYKDCFFLLIVSLNLFIGILQEIKAKKTIDRLSLISAPVGNVIRDKVEIDIPITDIVVDDIVVLTPGKQICCDCVLLEGGVEVDESNITGESDAIVKRVGDVLYSGSYVLSGNCKAVADKVGKDSYIQKLTEQAKKYVKPKSELMRSLKILFRLITFLIVVIGIALFVLQKNFTDLEYREIVSKTCGAIIGMIPSGLYLLTSITLAVGVIRLAKINTIVQELYCIEMLARVNVLCLDKTGTITDGTMTVKGAVEYPINTGMPLKHAIISHLTILNDDNMTSKALIEKYGKGRKFKYKKTISFSSQRKFSAIEYEKHGVFALGAPEVLFKENYHLIEEDVAKYTDQGLRVVVLAHGDGNIIDNELSCDLKPVCLFLIEDTIRKEAITTINYFNTHNVQVKVISGDNPLTVSRIAERAGVIGAENYINLDGLSDREVIRAATKYNVFGRVTPAQKKIIIQTLKKEKNTVAMTGDGVNDILALKEADCSIAMASGSEAARNVSHLVLLDSNFASMPKVVNEGRRVINNVQKVSILFLTKTIFSFLLSLIAIGNNGQYPISPFQLTMIDLLVIGIPSFCLALEPNIKQVKGRFIINVLKTAVPGALTVVIMTLIIYALKDTLNMNDRQIPTLIVISATFTCMMVLKNVCKPFNTFKKILFGTMFSMFVVCILFASMFFDFSPFWVMEKYIVNGQPVEPLSASHIILLICLFQASSTLITILSNIVPWTKKKINYIVNKITQI